jgi:hypothetical protein
LRETQQQNFELQAQLGQVQQQLQDPLQKVASGLADQYQQLQQQRSTGIKRMLRSFFGGVGAAMLHDASLASPEDQQANILQQMLQVQGAQTINTLRRAQAQNLELETREMPDGRQVQIPRGDVGAFDAAMARGSNSRIRCGGI